MAKLALEGRFFEVFEVIGHGIGTSSVKDQCLDGVIRDLGEALALGYQSR
jgi:hypothetical protein